jgi:hypothetical protein
MLDITNTKHFFWSAVGQLIANEPINLLASQQIRESYLDPATGTYQIVAGSFGDNTTTLFTSMAVSVPSGQVVRNPLGQVVLNLQFLASGITENLTSFITLPYSPVSIIPFIATAIVANTPYVLEGQIQTNGSLHLKSITGAIVVSSKVIINLTYDTAVRY